MKRLFIISALVFLAGCATPLPQTPPSGLAAQVPAPRIQSGEEWTYRVSDGFTGLARPTERYLVTEAGGDRVAVTVSREGTNDELQMYDGQWRWLKHPATNMQAFDYSPPYPAYAFPLAAGRTWNARLTATDPANGRRFPLTLDGVVLGWDRVKVPAGEFDALKVRRIVFLDYYEAAVRGRSEIIETEWYAPAVKQAVRRETTSRFLSYYLQGERSPGYLRVRDRSDGGTPRLVQDDWLIYELVSHTAR